MYRFNLRTGEIVGLKFRFKYNPCIGSMSMTELGKLEGAEFKYNPCIGSIMNAMLSNGYAYVFKYNPCIGSIQTSII